MTKIKQIELPVKEDKRSPRKDEARQIMVEVVNANGS